MKRILSFFVFICSNLIAQETSIICDDHQIPKLDIEKYIDAEGKIGLSCAIQYEKITSTHVYVPLGNFSIDINNNGVYELIDFTHGYPDLAENPHVWDGVNNALNIYGSTFDNFIYLDLHEGNCIPNNTVKYLGYWSGTQTVRTLETDLVFTEALAEIIFNNSEAINIKVDPVHKVINGQGSSNAWVSNGSIHTHEIDVRPVMNDLSLDVIKNINTSINEVVPDDKIEITDNSVAINNFYTNSDENNLYRGYSKIINGNETIVDFGYGLEIPNEITFNDLGPESLEANYAVVVYEWRTTGVTKKKYIAENISTLPFIPPSNILAENVDHDSNASTTKLVKVTWDHQTSIYNPKHYLVYRKDAHNSNWNRVLWLENGAPKLGTAFANLDGGFDNDNGYFYDETADINKTYLYKIIPHFPDEGCNYNNSNTWFNTDCYGEESTGAGIGYFDVMNETDAGGAIIHSDITYTAIPDCGKYILSVTQQQIPQDVTEGLAFEPGTGIATVQKLKLYTNAACTQEVSDGTYPSDGISYGSNGDFSGIEILDTDDTVTEIYGKISATRSDGKVFESFVPKEITGNKIVAPQKPIIHSTTHSTNPSVFEGYSRVNFSKYSTDIIEKIKVVRTEVDDSGQVLMGSDNVTPQSLFEYEIVNVSNSEFLEYNSSNLMYTFTDRVNDAVSFPLPNVCKNYAYTIETANCNNQWSTISNSVVLSPQSTESVFTVSKNLSVSNVMYKDKIHLSWDNNNDGIVSQYKIYRKQSSGGVYELIGSAQQGAKSFDDLYAESNVMYKYKVTAVIPGCDGSASSTGMSSNEVDGFRSPEASVSGFVRYETNSPVEDIDIIVEESNGLTNRAAVLNGSGGFILDDMFTTNSDQSFSVSLWHKYTGSNNQFISMIGRGNVQLIRIHGYSLDSGDTEYSKYIGPASTYFNHTETFSGAWPYVNNNSNTEYDLDWHNIICVYDDATNNLKFYIDGEISFQLTLNDEYFSSTDQLFIGEKPNQISGYAGSLVGNIDELSIWNKALTTEEVKSVSSSYLNVQDDDLLAYYHCDEGVGNTLYDFSKKSAGNYNLRHNVFDSNIIFTSTDTPNASQIKYKTKTDENGFYLVSGIRYVNDGGLYTVLPTNKLNNPYPTTHEFEPDSSIHYLGDNESYISEINFTDKTSVTVSGKVLYHVVNQGENSNITVIDKSLDKIGVAGVKVLLNGETMQTADGEVLETNAAGEFTCTVPIGTQYLSFEKDGYTFEYEWKGSDLASKRESSKQVEASFSASFESDLGEIACITYKELRGRITGGLTYQNANGVNVAIEDIPIGFDKAANTIGQVQFDIKQKDGTTDHKVMVSTDKTTGEYHAYVLPIEYTVDKSSFIASNTAVQTAFNDENYVFDNIDMTVKGGIDSQSQEFVEETLTSVDLSNSDNSTNSIDYHTRYDLTYRTSPSILVQQQQLNTSTSALEWSDFLGEVSYQLDATTNIPLKNTDDSYALGKPVFKELYGDNTYELKIDVREEYKNYGDLVSNHSSETGYLVDNTINGGEPFYHPMDEGTLNIQNEMLESGTSSFELDGSTIIYEFAPDNPHVFGIDEGYSRNLVIDYQNGTINASNDDPSVDGDTEVYLFGSESYGNDFFTFGPQVVDMILRDPAGDASYSFIEEGSTVTRTQSISKVNGESAEYNLDFKAGLHYESEVVVMAFFAGLGQNSELNLGLSTNTNNVLSTSQTAENEITFSETFTEAVSTAGEDFNIGAAGDVFLGESKNLNFGTSKKLHLIAASNCLDTEGIYECINVGLKDTNDSWTYKLGTKTMPSIRPGTNTKFAFTANYIENYLIPKLYFIRNAYLIGTYNVFSGKDEATISAMIDDPCWGEELNAPCFDINSNSVLDGANYYTHETNSTTYQLPVLSNYSNNQMANILGATLSDYQSDFNTSIANTSGVNNSELLSYSIQEQSNTSQLSSFINSINTGPAFDVPSLGDEQGVNDFIDGFTQGQDFSNIPGIINLENMINDLTNEVSGGMENVIIPKDKVAFYNQQIKLWKRALAQNELDKIESDFVTNHSISPGIEVENTHTSTGVYSHSTTVAYSLEETDAEGFYYEFHGMIFGFLGSEMEYSDAATLEFEFETSSTVESESEITVGYFLSDDDQGDILSVDVNNSKYGYGPVFKTQAGATSCPHEPATFANYILDFDLYFELQFYDRLAETTTQTLSTNLAFDYESYEFTWAGPISTGEDNRKIASWTDYRKIAKKKATYNADNTESNLTAFETARKTFYDAVKTKAQTDFESEFGVSLDANFLISGDTPEVELSATTSQREKPTLSVYPYNQYNVPEQEQAVFTITLGNESETGDDMVYILRVDEASNPDGAIIKVDGLSANREFMVPGGSTVTKTVTVEKGPRELNYENLGLILHSACQYEFATADESDIADSIYFSTYFLPTCTEVSVEDTDEDWLVNLTDNSIVNLKLKDYDVNYYSLEKIDLQYKYENDDWTSIESLESPLAVVNSENYKYMDALNLYNLLHSDFTLPEAINANKDEIEYWYEILEPSEKCEDNCQLVDFQSLSNYTASDLSDDENRHKDWYRWYASNADVTTCTLSVSSTVVESTSANYGSLSIHCFTGRSLAEKKAYVEAEIIRLKAAHLGTIPNSNPTAYYNSDDLMLSMRNQTSTFAWTMPALPNDGEYLIRAKSDCGDFTPHTGGAPEDVIVYSPTYELYSDRIRPSVFGNIQPADGILDPNDEILLTFNEAINEMDFNVSTSEIFVVVKAKKNGTQHTDDAYLYFDAEDEMEIPAGVIIDGSFTLEMWVQPEMDGILFEQTFGANSNTLKLELKGIGATDTILKFSFDDVSSSNNDVSIDHDVTLSSEGFTHIAVSYDANATTGQFTVYEGSTMTSYDLNMSLYGEGAIEVGETYIGSIHDLRIWNTVRSSADVLANKNVSLSGREANLVGYWPMDELKGNPQDKARYRHATTSAQWTVDSENKARVLDGTVPNVSQEVTPIAISATSDFTVEAWFKSSSAAHQTLFSLGDWGDGTNTGAWSIDLNDGNLEVYQSGSSSSTASIASSGTTYDDNQWHHLALVKSDVGNTRLYVDGNEVAQEDSDNFSGIGVGKMVLGARMTSTSGNYDKFFNGSIDEIRVWNLAKTIGQIVLDANNGLDTEKDANNNFVNEIGLEAYLHFDDEDANVSDTDVPLVRVATTKTTVSFDDVSNGDQVFVNITENLNKIENTILNITVQNVEDLNGNTIENPITWDVYVDKNQLIWDEQLIEKEKLLGGPMVFETHIVNQGGTVEQFEISNLPDWLTAMPSEGLLEPNSFQQIEFVVNEDLFIGDYQEDLILTGNNEYGERLEFKLEVEAPTPIFDLDPNEFLYTMNFVGKVTVDNIRSRDDKDILFAYVGDELRGATNLLYIEDYDAYFVFFSVYSNSNEGETVEFRLWDASEGKIQSQVKIDAATNIVFQDGSIVGAFDSPTHFEAINMLRQEIPLNEGWNWVSFNLDAEDQAADQYIKIPTVTAALAENHITNLKSQTAYAQYADIEGLNQNWFGSLLELSVKDMYMIQISQEDTIVYEGQAIDPTTVPISITDGWNWVGYLGQRVMNTNEALASLNPSSGDVIKSKTAFSMYANESLGWLGTLSNMKAGEGYMLNHSGTGSLIYPESSMYGGGSFRLDRNHYADKFWKVHPYKYEHSMSMVAKIDHPDYERPNRENLLGAFKGINCLGNISATEINAEESLYFLTIYGQQEDLVVFDYYDAEKDKVYNAENVIEFEPNQALGTIEHPYIINIDVEAQEEENFFALDVYPNPFADVFDIAFVIEESAEVEVQLYDVMGRFVQTISKGTLEMGAHKVHVEGDGLSKGVYFVEVLIGDKVYKKMVVKS